MMPKWNRKAVLGGFASRTAGLLLAAILALGFAGVASAELTDTFELDGNAITDNPVPGLPDDWDRLYDGAGHAALWTGVLDDYGAEETTRFTGSKDILEIEKWRWDSKPITPKNEIENAYAALYTGGHFIFGSDRFRTSGSAQMGFWLLQGDISLNPDGTFNGTHVDGDALILSHFSSGGRVSDIELYLWDTTRPPGDRLVQVTPLDSTVVYAFVSDIVTSSPWEYEPDKGNPNEFQPLSFFEGAADLGALGITGCFSNFLAETRTSFSLTAELKDFVLGEFPATPEVTVNSEAVCEGESAELCATVTGGLPPYTFSWTGPASFTATTQCTGPISVAGTYTVIATGANGCASGPAVGTLMVHPLPACSITGDDTICDGETTDFCGPADMSVYSWTGPASFAAATQCTGPIGVAGTYVLTITDANGCQNTCDRVLTVYDLPVCDITGDNDICIGATTDFCGPGGMSVYSWTGPGGFTGSLQCTGPIGVAGTYVLTITDANGCQNTCDRVLTLYDLPLCEITGDDTICDGETTDFCASGGMSAYSWTGPAGFTAATQCTGPIGTAGTYTVTITDANGCQSTCDRVLTVYDLPVCNVTGDDTVCDGETTDFCGPVGMSVYSWTGPGGFTGSLQCTGPIAVAGTYVLTITDANGCQSTCDRVLTVYDLPVCDITGDPAVCLDFTTEWCAPGSPGGGVTYSYVWNGPEQDGATTQCITIGTAGTYTLTVTDNRGCQSQCQKTLAVYDLPICSITRTGGEADTVCPCFPENPDATHEYCGPDVAGYTYSWSIAYGAEIISDTDIRCVEVKPMAHCDTLFTLTLVVVDENGCSSTCEKTAYVVDNTPPEITYCPPDTVIECHDLGDVWPVTVGINSEGVFGTPTATDNCDPSPWVNHADKGERPTNWQRRVDDWGTCGEDTTILRMWYVTDFCGNVDSSCVQAIAIQDTMPPRLDCPPDERVPCGTPVVFGTPTASDSCDPPRLVEIIVESTSIVPGPGPGEFTHTKCWTATDSCGNLSPMCCQTIIVEPCPEEFCTFTMGGWGSGCPGPQQGDSLSTQPGCIRDHYFARVFPAGVLIGDPGGLNGGPLYAALWSSAGAVENFLPAGETPRALEGDLVNPLTTPAGVLAGQVLALHMNVGYSCEPTVFDDMDMTDGVGCYASYEIPDSCGSAFAGMTVASFLAIADSAVAGDTGVLATYGVTLSEINFAATCLNEAFDNCDPFRAERFQVPSPYSLDSEEGSEIETPASAPIPTRFTVSQSYPNPFNPSAKVNFALPSDGKVTIEVYDIVGRKVITLLDTDRQAGYHSVTWFGKDNQGRPVASGVYFCRVQYGDKADVKKMILLK